MLIAGTGTGLNSFAQFVNILDAQTVLVSNA